MPFHGLFDCLPCVNLRCYSVNLFYRPFLVMTAAARLVKFSPAKFLLTHIKDLKTSDVQNPNEVLPGLLGVQLLVDAGDHPQEHLLIDGFGQSTHCIVHLHGQSNDCYSY